MPAEQRGFDFASAVPDVRDLPPALPVNGSGPMTRHASLSGAACAVKTWAWKQSTYLQILEAAGAMSDPEMAGVTGWPLSSVCSTRNALKQLLTVDGFETAEWSEGRCTRRTRWKLR